MATTPPETETDPAVGAPPDAQQESFGTWLRRQRELREISLREIADTSKISLRYLQALEDDRFELLPAPVFAKGFLRQYARYVGLDPEETVNFYLAADGLEEPEDEPEVPPRRPRSMTIWAYALAALLAAVLLMAVVWTVLRLNSGAGEAQEGEVALPPAAAAPRQTEPRPAPPADPAATAEAPAGDREAAAAAAETLLAVTLDFRGDCWVRATVDGDTREDRVYTQGESLQLEAREIVELELGKASEVDVEVNGHPLDLSGSSGAVRRLKIDRAMAAALERG